MVAGPCQVRLLNLLVFIENNSNTSFSGIAQGIPQGIAQGTASSSSFTMPASVSTSSTPASALTPSTGPGGRRGIPKQDFNHKKFLPETSPLSPFVIPAWAAALAQVSKDFRDVWDHDGRLNLKGYACVDPFIIVSSANRERANKTLISWLFVRSFWLSRTITNDMDNAVKMPSPQDWRDFLMKVGRQTGVDKEALRERRNPSRKKAYAGAVENLFDNLPKFQGPVDLFWAGALLRRKDQILEGKINIEEGLAREIVWDAFEHCWRMELLSLDRTIWPRRNMTAAGRLEREAMVVDVFPRGLLIMHQVSARDEGLGAKDWKNRRGYVEAFQLLLRDWPGAPATLTSMPLDSSSNAANLAAVEAVAYTFYCQTFWNYAGRAPSVPHILP
jgi:hypothetical protein